MTYALSATLVGITLAMFAAAQDAPATLRDDGRATLERNANHADETVADLISSDNSGTKSYTVRGSSVAGVRVQFEDFAVPAGSAVYVQNEDGSESYGPFTAAGPNQDSQFLSPIIHGNTVRIVLESADDVPPVLPYNVRRVIGVGADEVARFDAAPPAKPGDDGEARTSLYGGVPIEHATVAGLAIHEGDIVLGETKNLQAADDVASKGMERRSFGIPAYPMNLWPHGVLAYVVDSTVVSKSTVTAAVNAWNSAFGDNIQLVPRTTQSNYVYFTRNPLPSSCASFVGMMGGAQPIYVGDYCTAGNLIHEIGHAFGLLHEHTRLDRNNYVTINTANLNATFSFNFNIATYGTDLGPYDFGSIMHYPATAFSINGQPTITTKPPGIAIGQRVALSAGDIAGINAMYRPTNVTTNPTITIATNPPGLIVYIDGVAYGTPKTLTAPAGSVHTIAAQSTIASTPGARFLFGSWSNGSALKWTLSMPTTNTTYTANYAKQYYVKASAGAGGTATVSPADSDGWYNAGTVVSFAATPMSGYAFSSWSGFAAGTPATTSMTLNATFTPTANFVAGTSAPRFRESSATYTRVQSYGSTYLYATTPWTATVSAPWVVLCMTPSGTSDKNFPYIVYANTTGVTRTATITVGSAKYTITQLP